MLQITIQDLDSGLAPIIRNYEVVDANTEAIAEGAREMADVVIESAMRLNDEEEEYPPKTDEEIQFNKDALLGKKIIEIDETD